MSADGPAIYCGAIVEGERRELVYATMDGIWARPQRLATRQTSPWMTVEDWQDDPSVEARLLATEADLVGVLVRVPDQVRLGLLEAWRCVVRLRDEARARAAEVVLGPGDWTAVDLTAAVPS